MRLRSSKAGMIEKTSGAEKIEERSLIRQHTLYMSFFDQKSQICSVIVHLHLNRFPQFPPLLYPGEPAWASALVRQSLHEIIKHRGKAVVHVKGCLILHRGIDQAPIQLRADAV